jgi:hypothetical protein
MSTATPEMAGPLPLHLLGAAPCAKYAGALDRVKGHGSSDKLLPAGLFGQLDLAHDAFLVARVQLARRLNALAEQERAYRIQDAARQHAVEQAAAKLEDSPPDERTPAPDRRAALSVLHAEAWAAVLCWPTG